MQFNDQFYNQNEGLAMGAPTSAILTETFIQNLEHNNLIKILNNHQIINYHRYVDDILIVYNKNTTNINSTLDECNTIHPKIKFTIETENHNTLNYLDLTITNSHNKLTFGIYRNRTNTNLIIHSDSCHPYEHKKSAITYLVNCMTIYPITHENKILELNTINAILTNNHSRYITNINQHNTPKHKPHATTKIKKDKWVTFTYYGPETRMITRPFKNNNIGIAFKTNTIKKTSNTKKEQKQITDVCQKSGVYELKCNECPFRYVVQTGRTFMDRYREHIQAIRTNKHTSKYAQHILDSGHA
jgi:hypothetical protein